METEIEIEWDTIKILCDFCEKNQADMPVLLERNEKNRKLYEDWKKQNIDLMGALFQDSGLELRPNDFPYPFEENLTHLVLWIHPDSVFGKLGPRISKELIEHLNKLLENYNYSEYVYFRNQPNFRSVKKIPHYHIVLRKV